MVNSQFPFLSFFPTKEQKLKNWENFFIEHEKYKIKELQQKQEMIRKSFKKVKIQNLKIYLNEENKK